MRALITTVFLCLSLSKVFASDPAVEFDLPKGSNNAYVGQLFYHEASVKLSPQLRAFTNPSLSHSNKICGFHPIVKDPYEFPFEVDLKDPALGIGEIRVRNDAPVDFTQNRMYTFQIEAYDCDSPPQYSERVLVNINIRADEELRFTDAVYNLTAETFNSIGSICGKVTVMHESSNPPIFDKERQCGYSLQSGGLVPFDVDSHGVIRTTEVLTPASPRNYRFIVQYKDCNGALVKTASTMVNVRVIQSSCQPKWIGLPNSLFYSQNEPQPKRLFWPANYHLETCGMTCEPGEDSRVYTQVSLRPTVASVSLVTASPSFCRHDPRSLHEQRKLCAIDSQTVVDLLPDPYRDMMAQHLSPAVGRFPEVVPLSMAIRFSAADGSGWRLDTQHLLNAATATNERDAKVLPSNLFERDFTLSFWLQREPKGRDEHETILCSQEDTATVSRALWISLKGCRVMVQMTAGNPESSDPLTNKIFRTYFSPELPKSVCDAQQLRQQSPINDQGRNEPSDGPFAWHHYSINIVFEPASADLSASTLMVDGELIGSLETFSQPIHATRPSKEFFAQYVTVGTCYEPSASSSMQSLNGALAGMTLLLGRNEDQSVSRCLAECGEILLIPRASRLITDDINVLLNNDNIVIESVTSQEAAEILSNIAYVKPRSTSTQLTFEPAGSDKRFIDISTVYRCGSRTMGNISTSVIPLQLEDVIVDGAPAISDQHSNWVPENEMVVKDPITNPTNDQAPSTLLLKVIGETVVRANIPVLEPGIVMFPGLAFTFTNVPSQMKSVMRSASMFILDDCLVLPVNGSGLDFSDGERIVWPAGRAFELGVSVEPSQTGVLMKGRQTASQYASLLHDFRYWPPVEIEKRANDKSLANGLLLERKFQLICSYNEAGFTTEPFTVQIQLSSPIIAQEAIRSGNVVYSDNSRLNADDEDLDDDDDYYDDSLDDLPLDASANQWPPAGRYQRLNPSDAYLSAMGDVQFAHSDKELRSAKSLALHEKDPNESGNSRINTTGLAIGLSLGCFAIMVIVIAFFASKSKVLRRHGGQLSFSRRGNAKDSGRIHFRPEPRLNVIENPIDKMEGGKLSWQPPIVTAGPTPSEGLPGVHAAYRPRDEQFDAETRSFNGLFEEGEEEDGSGTDEEMAAAAALEEVDDFDESEAVLSQHVIGRAATVNDEEGDEMSEGEDTSFSVGPNHLDFVTLPGPRRGFEPNV